MGGNVQKSSFSKAAALLTRGAYSQYVSTAKWRERRWRLFSTFPLRKSAGDIKIHKRVEPSLATLPTKHAAGSTLGS